MSEHPRLYLPVDVRDSIVAHAQRGIPEEICGVFGGEFDEDESRVRSHYPATNAADRPRVRYEVDPEEGFEIFELIEERGEGIVGFYHSHPEGPPEPSRTDVSAATWPDRSYLIVALEPDLSVRSFRWREDERFEEERVILE